MTFNTSKRKIFSMWNDSIKNSFSVDELSSTDQIILNKVDNLNRNDTIYNNIVEFNSEWLNPITVLNKNTIDNPPNPEQIISLSHEHSIVFNGIHSSIMPYIQSKVSYRLGDGLISIPIPVDGNGDEFDEDNPVVQNFRINSIIEILPTINSDGETTEVNTITYRTSVFTTFADVVGDTGFPPELQLKFYVSIINPMYYQTT